MSDPTTEIKDEEINLDKYFAAIWRAKWLIIMGVLLAAAVAAITGLRQPVTYEATALVEIGRVWKEPLEDPYAVAQVASSPGFIDQLSARTGLNPAYLKRSLRAETITGGPSRSRYAILVRISATAQGADESVRLAQAMADELMARHEKLFRDSIAPHLERQQQLEQRIKEIMTRPGSPYDLIAGLESELAEVKSSNSSPTVTEKTHLTGPIIPVASARPPVWRNSAVASLLAAIVGATAATLVSHFKSAQPATAAARHN